jgi:hypothetical protein
MADGTQDALAPKIVTMICRQAIENPESASNAMLLLESVVAGSIGFLVKPGCDEEVVERFFEAVKVRLAKLREAELKHAEHGGTA